MQRTVLLMAIVALAGCSGSRQAANNRETAAQAYNEGLAAFESRDYQAAIEKFTESVESGWLHANGKSDALTKRAVANAALGNLDAANADLQNVGPEGNQSMILAAKAFVLKKQGKTADAQRAFQQAKRLNPGVKPFE